MKEYRDLTSRQMFYLKKEMLKNSTYEHASIFMLVVIRYEVIPDSEICFTKWLKISIL